jgi:hypothetical protein
MDIATSAGANLTTGALNKHIMVARDYETRRQSQNDGY